MNLQQDKTKDKIMKCYNDEMKRGILTGKQSRDSKSISYKSVNTQTNKTSVGLVGCIKSEM